MRRALAAALALLLAAPAAFASAQAEDWRARSEAALEAGETARARAVLEAAAGEGDRAAQTRLADLLREGRALAQNLIAAADWYARAADQGHAPAQNALGRMYFEGIGRPVDRAQGLERLAQAARQGDLAHMHDYAAALEAEDQVEAAALWYERAAALGHPPALASLGVLVLEGRGAASDPARALDLFQRAAQAGDARGLNNLGLLYARGEAVERDYARAAELFQAAADQGLAEAMTNLAVLYENGFGVPLDEAEAVRLYREAGRAGAGSLEALLAAAGAPWPDRLADFDPSDDAAARDAAAAAVGDPVARFSLGYRAALGLGRPQNHREAARRFAEAADQGFAPASLHLGLLHARGLGTPQNYLEAYIHLARAAAAGEPGAAELRDAVFARMGERQRAAAAERADEIARD
ncbi:MAG: tetratricopeptide repeat protein [Oceanicaulis sp.]